MSAAPARPGAGVEPTTGVGQAAGAIGWDRSARTILAVAFDILREAAYRRWFLALFAGITLVLGFLALTLRLEVVGGALAAARLFGVSLGTDIRSVDVAMGLVYRGSSYVVFYGGLGFGIVACSDFAPRLLSPGRVEHLLSLPVRRVEVLAGTFLGVMSLATLGALYGAGGLVAVLGAKTGAWTARPVLAALMACAAFAAVYGAMLAAAVFARSAALSAAVGAAAFGAGIVAGYRDPIGALMDAGVGREVFLAATLFVPRVSALADAAASLASSVPVDWWALTGLVGGLWGFGLAALAVATWRMEGADF